LGEAQNRLDVYEDAVRMLAADLAPSWNVRFHRGLMIESGVMIERPVRVDLEHPLSDGHGWDPTREHVELCDTGTLRDVVAEPEFEHIAHAPECEHEQLVRAIRRMARMFGWRNVEVRTLVDTLYETGCITHDEYEWLAAYTGREMMAGSRISWDIFAKRDADSSKEGRE
jgi:hypothetical protein